SSLVHSGWVATSSRPSSTASIVWSGSWRQRPDWYYSGVERPQRHLGEQRPHLLDRHPTAAWRGVDQSEGRVHAGASGVEREVRVQALQGRRPQVDVVALEAADPFPCLV